MWGQARLAVWQADTLRIIPMRVGTSACQNLNKSLPADHPHACGDKDHLSRLKSNIIGSSPCVWGQGGFALDWESSLRIIPMRVGTRRFECVNSITKQDHPHACGDKLCQFLLVNDCPGSSPCVWGQD